MSRMLGGYELIADLGWGGIGVVHAGRRSGGAGLRKRVAVEVLGGALMAEPERLRRYLAEVGRAAEVEHPNVLQVFEVGEAEGCSFVVQEFVDGCLLERLLAALSHAKKRLPAALAARVLADASAGLAAAHDLGLVHGDLAADRVLLGYATGQAKVTGFGAVAARPVAPRQGSPEARMGCSAPECFEGAAPDARTDVFALGAILYRASLGRAPFSGPTDAAVMHAVLKGDPAVPSRLDPTYPPDLERVVLRALARDPASRPASVAEFGGELERFLETARASHAGVRAVLQTVFPVTDPERAQLASQLDLASGPAASAQVSPRAAPLGSPAAAPLAALRTPPPVAAPPRARRVTESRMPAMASSPPSAPAAPQALAPKPATPPVTVTPPRRNPSPASDHHDLWAELDRLEREFPPGDS